MAENLPPKMSNKRVQVVPWKTEAWSQRGTKRKHQLERHPMNEVIWSLTPHRNVSVKEFKWATQIHSTLLQKQSLPVLILLVCACVWQNSLKNLFKALILPALCIQPAWSKAESTIIPSVDSCLCYIVTTLMRTCRLGQTSSPHFSIWNVC